MKRDELLKGIKKINIELLKNSDISITENDRQALEIYNSAIDNIKVGSEDIAVIKLKKVIAMRTDFNEARELLKRVIEYEKQKSLGQKMLESMTKATTQKDDARKITSKKNLPQILDISPRLLMKIIIIALCIVLVGAVTVVGTKLLIKQGGRQPAQPVNNTEDIQLLNTKINELEAVIASENETNESNQKLITEKDQKIEDLQNENVDLKHLVSLYKAKAFFEDERYTESAKLINTLKDVDFEGYEAEIYDQVYTLSKKEAAKSLYTIGLNLFNQQDYENALKNLTKALEYDPEFEDMGQCLYVIGKSYYELDNPSEAVNTYKKLEISVPGYENKAGVIYHTAKAYAKMGQKQKAIELFNLVINNYPKSSLVGYSKDRLRELNQGE